MFQDFVRKMKELLPTVPGEEGVEDPATEIKGTVQSPQVSTEHLYSIIITVGIPNSVPIENLALKKVRLFKSVIVQPCMGKQNDPA